MALLRPSIQDVNINPDDVIPSEEKLKQFELVQQLQQICAATQAKMQADQSAATMAGGGGGEVPPAVPNQGAAPEQPETAPPAPGSVAERRNVA